MNRISLRSAALIAGLSILVLVLCAPFAELYVFPKLVIPGNAEETVKNIRANEGLFIAGIFAFLITFLFDIVAAWALYILLKPVNDNLSLLAGWFRLVFSIIAIVALMNLLTVLRLIGTAEYLKAFEPEVLNAQIMLALNAFRQTWHFGGIIFFGIHLMLLGYLVFISGYIPKILGALIVISGIGYLISAIGPYLFPEFNLRVIQFTFFGELIFMIWLLVRGHKIKDHV